MCVVQSGGGFGVEGVDAFSGVVFEVADGAGAGCSVDVDVHDAEEDADAQGGGV